MRIAISGAGVAGPALAYWLVRAGHEPTLIEHAPCLRTGGYMIDFWGVGYEIADRMGLLPAIVAAGYAVREVRMVDDRGRRAGGFSTALFRRALGDRFISLPRGDLASAVYRSLEGRVETIFGDGISAIAENDGGVRVSLAKGRTREFELVVGADGLHSTVRALVFGPEHLFERRVGYFVAAFEAEGYRPRDELVYVSHSVPGRQAARFSQRGDLTMFLFVFAAEHMIGPEPLDLAARKAALHRVFDGVGWECPRILAAMDEAREIYFDRVNQIEMAAWAKGRVGLIGDAAPCVSLLAGEGSGLAMAEAYVLAGELKRAGDDYRQAFRRYERRLRPLIGRKQRAARKFAGSFAPRSAAGVWLRNQATRLMTIPAVADLLLGRALSDEFDLPDYGM